MINAFGPVFGHWSFAVHARHFFRALHRRTPLALFANDEPDARQEVPPDFAEMIANAGRGLSEGPGVGIGAIPNIPNIRGAWRIAFVVWEPTRLPAERTRYLRMADELWTPSEWGRQLLADNGFDEGRVRVVPEGVDTEMFRPLERDSGGDADRPVRFLTVTRWQPRKGLDDLLTVFLREFRRNEPVHLVVHGGTAARLQEELRRRGIENDPRITYSGPRDDRGMARLYNECDAFVLPTKAEGWGLPVMEAMACARPVIVTNYSAPVEFVSESTGYLIRVAEMIDVRESGQYPSNSQCGQWAQPDLDHLQYLMRHVYEHRREAAEIGRKAREEVCTQWTWDHAAGKALSVLGLS